MEIIYNNNNGLIVSAKQTIPAENKVLPSSQFIQANTEEVSFDDIKRHHIIPVYTKDNEPLISHYDFIEATWEVASHFYGDGNVGSPVVRVSHPIKGRVPEARNKPASELLENECTLYYERMMFLLEVPGNFDEIAGNTLTLTIGGVKAYNLDSLSNKKGSLEHFKVFVGFKNRVCTNLCVSTDGLLVDLTTTSKVDLQNKVYDMLCNYNALEHLQRLQALPNYSLTEHQFAQLIGRSRLYQHLTPAQRIGITPLQFGDQQINTICKDYYKDKSFCRKEDGSISLWRLYNLFTGANKNSYIDNFLERGQNAEQFVFSLKQTLDEKSSSWFLS